MSQKTIANVREATSSSLHCLLFLQSGDLNGVCSSWTCSAYGFWVNFSNFIWDRRQPGDARWIVGNGTLNVPCGDFSINAVMFTVVLTKIKCWMLKALCLSWNNGEVGSFTFSFSLGGVLVPCREVPLAHTYVQKGVLWSKINDMLRWALSQGFQIMKVTLF